uniref:Uncharacterized protein n=1 Tax=Anguilla anguilla TaxID=7936 RepID=A0A0E9SIQ7_ANGAN
MQFYTFAKWWHYNTKPSQQDSKFKLGPYAAQKIPSWQVSRKAGTFTRST